MWLIIWNKIWSYDWGAWKTSQFSVVTKRSVILLIGNPNHRHNHCMLMGDRSINEIKWLMIWKVCGDHLVMCKYLLHILKSNRFWMVQMCQCPFPHSFLIPCNCWVSKLYVSLKLLLIWDKRVSYSIKINHISFSLSLSLSLFLSDSLSLFHFLSAVSLSLVSSLKSTLSWHGPVDRNDSFWATLFKMCDSRWNMWYCYCLKDSWFENFS